MKTKNKRGLNLKAEERFLFEKLPDVMRLEAAMKDIRQKYFQFWDDICRRVQGEHAKLNHPCNHSIGSYPQVGIGRECWRSADKPWPSGLYIANIGFENLCSSDEKAPCAGIWLKPPKEMRVDLESFKEPVRLQAEQQLGQKLLAEGGAKISLWFDLPQSRHELLGMLIKKKETQFADCMVSHFGRLAKLIPIIDKVFKTGTNVRRKVRNCRE